MNEARDESQRLIQATLSRRAYEGRMRRRRRIRRLLAAIAACFFGCLLLLMATQQINRVQIREIVFEGNLHYDTATLSELSPVRVGDAMFRFDPEAATDSMLEALPYLRELQWETSLRGVLRVSVQERQINWALRFEDEGGVRYWLLDEQLVAVEMVAFVPAQVCMVDYVQSVEPSVGESLKEAAIRADREAKEAKEEGGALAAVQQLEEYLSVLALHFSAASPNDRPAVFEASAPYEKVLILQDGTRYLLGAARELQEQLSLADTAAAAYRAQHPGALVSVDVKDPARIYVRETADMP